MFAKIQFIEKNMMKKIGKLFKVILFACFFAACSGDDERDDTVLDISMLTGKDWYYNAWLGSENGFDSEDLLEVIRFEKGGNLKHIDFGGRNESIVGKWESSAETNLITLIYGGGKTETWHVQRSGHDYIEAIINEQGSRRYVSELSYLEDLTADAFLVNEHTLGNQYITYIGADVRGNRNIRDGKILKSDGTSINLKNHGFYWTEEKPESINFDGKSKELRFHLRIGSEHNIKLKDMIYSSNLPERLLSEMDLNVDEENGEIEVSWHPYSMDGVYYKVEILSENEDLKNPYFISRIQRAGASSLTIKNTTAGEVNRMNDLEQRDTYTVRLTALLYETGVDAWNDGYGYANVQAVSHFTKKQLKE